MERRAPSTRATRRARVLAVALRSAALLLGLASEAQAQALAVASAPPLSASPATGRVADSVARSVASEVGLSPEEVVVPVLGELEALATDQKVEVRVAAVPGTQGATTLPVTVVLLRGSQEIARSALTVRLRPLRPVLVATRALRRGALLGQGDVREEQRPNAPVDAAPPFDPSDALALTRSVSAGAVLRESWLAPPTAVERGQSVRLRAGRGGLAVEAAGRALEDGHTGELIRVMNLASRRVLSGRVVGSGAIEMDF